MSHVRTTTLAARRIFTSRLALLALATTACSLAPDEPVDSTSEGLTSSTPVVEKELMVTDVSVVDDPARTGPGGAWSFGTLMTAMAGSNDPSDFVLAWLRTWETAQTVNGTSVAARPQIDPMVIDRWPRLPGTNKLDLSRSPMRLLAIVNRVDLRNLGRGNAGEGRFVFELADTPIPGATPFNVILEYKLPAKTPAEVFKWAKRWHRLGNLAFGADYNVALQSVTDLFARAGVAPARPNGSAISQVRTNDFKLATPWELREFHLDGGGRLVQAPAALTPSTALNGTAELARYVGSTANVIQRNAMGENSSLFLSSENVVARASILAVADANWQIAGVGDFDADGSPDLVWRHQGIGVDVVWFMNGDRAVSSAVLPTVADLNWHIQAVGDLTQDGEPDLLWHNTQTGAVLLWPMHGTTRLPTVSLGTVAPSWKAAGIADFDSDARNDIVWRNYDTGENVVWFMDGAGAHIGSGTLPLVSDTSMRLRGVFDVDHDGHPDLFWRNVGATAAGQTSVSFMNGIAPVRTAIVGKPDPIWNVSAVDRLALSGGAADNGFAQGTSWTVPGVGTEARFEFAANTCSGCHQRETGTQFVHIDGRAAGQASRLSAFLTGETVVNPIDGVTRTFGDLNRRARDLTSVLTGTTASALSVSNRTH